VKPTVKYYWSTDLPLNRSVRDILARTYPNHTVQIWHRSECRLLVTFETENGKVVPEAPDVPVCA
jgi:hypothetical protein